jgi:GxxExxY protein
MQMTKKYLDELTYKVIGCAIEVHRQLGPGLLESIYEKCFVRELELQDLKFQRQLWVPLEYKGVKIGSELRLDVLVEDVLCVELKSNDGFAPIHDSVLLSYMKMLQKPKGVLINFNCVNIFKDGQRTLVNRLFLALPEDDMNQTDK